LSSGVLFLDERFSGMQLRLHSFRSEVSGLLFLKMCERQKTAEPGKESREFPRTVVEILREQNKKNLPR
jgi:hypothetical protein